MKICEKKDLIGLHLVYTRPVPVEGLGVPPERHLHSAILVATVVN